MLWRDQWQFLGELQSVYEGKNWAGVLWSPYWGHRPVIPRLLFYLDARFFSFRNTPLLCVSWACLLAQIALIAVVNRAIFGRFASWRFAAALIVTLNLCLSSFQLENLIWALQVQYTLVIFCAVVSFVLFALSIRAKAANGLLLASCISALAGSLTMAQGLAIWPVLGLQAWVCRSSRRVQLGLLAIFFVAVGIYAVGYQTPDTGMGLRGELSRPLRALEIGLMVLGGPISNESLPWGMAAGAAGLLGLIGFVIAVHRDGDAVWPSVHLAIVLFAVATAFLTVGGRISPEFLKQRVSLGGEILPSRYLTFAFVFWTSMFTVSLWALGTARSAPLRALALLAAAAPCYFVIAYAHMQPIVADAWADAMHSFDATGTSFLVGAPDWERQKLLWGYRSQLEDWVEFARAHRLANFSEERFAWLSRSLTDQFQVTGDSRCEGKLESAEQLSETTWRVNGWAWNRDSGKPPADLVLVDDDGRICGLARSGLPHHDTGGHSGEVVIYRAGWLGYMRCSDPAKIKTYAVLGEGRTVCPIRRDAMGAKIIKNALHGPTSEDPYRR